jgi:4-amino-4-deoxy-L-arabinose transferase-like glycosyltransferase
VNAERRARTPPLAAALLALLLIAATARWIALDSQVPDFDSAKHLLTAWSYSNWLGDLNLGQPFSGYTEYPPLAHLIGAVATLIAGRNVGPPILGVAIVCVPLLAYGLYRAGTLLGNSWTGLFAVLFAAGTPMVVTEFRAYMLETTATALLAVVVWLLIASRRFERLVPAVVAGVVVGLGMLTKQSFAFFVAGFVAMLVLRGGWRNWRGMAAFAGAAILVGAPWYVAHWDELRTTSEWALGQNSEGPIWGAKNLSFYVWSFLNRQFMLPLLVLFAVGVVVSVVAFVRRPALDDHTPELLAGLAVGWAALTFYLKLKSPYYALPITVFVALLGTVWLARVREPVRRAAVAGLALVAAVNFAVAAFHIGDPPGWRVALPGASDAPGVQSARHVTFASPEAWPGSLGPGEHGDIVDTIRALKRRGVRRVEFDVGSDVAYFNTVGLTALTTVAGVLRPPTFNPDALEAPDDAFIGREPTGPDSCRPLGDGTSIYVTLGPPTTGRRICPR